MAPGSSSGPASSSSSEGVGGNGSQVRRFLRSGQIFSAAVREFVGRRCLSGLFRHPLTVPQIHLLKSIARDRARRVGEVAAFLGVSTPAATKCVDKLERLGLVTRAASPDDRRATLISASVQGRRLVGEYERIKRERLEPILDEFEPAEVDMLVELLERFAVALYVREHPESGSCIWCGADFDDDCAIAGARGGCPAREIESTASMESGKS